MKKLAKRISAIILAFLICFITTIAFYPPERVEAAPIAIEYTALEVLQWLGLSAGVTFAISDTEKKLGMGEEIVKEVSDTFELWARDNGWIAEDVRQGLDYAIQKGKTGVIEMPDKLWKAWKNFTSDFAQNKVTSSPYMSTASDFNLANICMLAYGYVDMNRLSALMNEVNSSTSNYRSRLDSYMHSYFSGSKYLDLIVLDDATWGLEIWLVAPLNSSKAELIVQNETTYKYFGQNMCAFCIGYTSGKVKIQEKASASSMGFSAKRQRIVNNIFYGIGDDLSTGTRINATAVTSLKNGTYDVLTKKKTKVDTGDVAITIPESISVRVDDIEKRLHSIDDAIALVNENVVSLGDVLDDAYVYPVDVATGQSIYKYYEDEKEDSVPVALPITQVMDMVAALDVPIEDEKEGDVAVVTPIPGGSGSDEKEDDYVIDDVDLVVPGTIPMNMLGDFSILQTKFPFCIPFDLFAMIRSWNAGAEAPKFHFEYKFDSINYTFVVDVDMSDYEEYIMIFRDGFFILFCVGLVIVTGRVIKWI